MIAEQFCPNGYGICYEVPGDSGIPWWVALVVIAAIVLLIGFLDWSRQ